MKKLFLIRHGKSSWEFPDLHDKDRPLKKRGRRDGLVIGKKLKEANVEADLIISSPANRAHSSAVIIAQEIGYPESSIILEDRIYFEGIKAIFDVINNIKDHFNTVLMFGHNPDFTTLANQFSDDYIDNVPTTGVIGIEFDIENWKDASTENGKLILFDYPSRYR